MNRSGVFRLTVLATTVAYSSVAGAGCRIPRTPERGQFTSEWTKAADLVADVEVVRTADLRRGTSELLKVVKVYKGHSDGIIALWAPAKTDEVTTVESPTTGHPVGSRLFVVLVKTSKGWIIPACSSVFSSDPQLKAALVSLAH